MEVEDRTSTVVVLGIAFQCRWTKEVPEGDPGNPRWRAVHVTAPDGTRGTATYSVEGGQFEAEKGALHLAITSLFGVELNKLPAV